MQAQYLIFTVFLSVAWSQSLQPSTTPVPILKQINRQNDDGSYSYGYENADGSFKIETKFANGEVYGKYGYVDADGKVREVEYGATRRGFEPTGTGIDVPPPTLVNENALQNADYDDGQYREDPSIYWKTDKFNSVPAKSAPKAAAAAPTPSRQTWSAPQQQTRSWSAPQQVPQQNWNSVAATPAPVQEWQVPQQQARSWSAPQQVPQQNWNSVAATPAPVQQWQAPQQNVWSAPQPTWAPPQTGRSWAQPQQQWQAPAAPAQQRWAAPQQNVDPNLFVGHPATNIDLASGSFSVSYIG